ncbi:10828_t:CDS:2, partial [Cetraspora pellucida]
MGNGLCPSDNRDQQRGTFNSHSGNGRNRNGGRNNNGGDNNGNRNKRAEATATDLKDHFNLFGSVYKVIIEMAEYNGVDRSLEQHLFTL